MTAIRQGKIIMLTGPSGVGKDTIAKNIRQVLPNLRSLDRYTTRPMRPGEQNGIDYFFVDEPMFHRMAEAGEFIEFCQTHGNWYATALKSIPEALDAGNNILTVIDVKGAKIVRNKFPETICIYIQYQSGSLENQIRARLENDSDRGAVDEEEFQRRLATAFQEEEEKHHFNYLITNYNDRLNETIEQVLAIIDDAISEHQ